jgi:DNA primase small subunit
MNHLLKAPFCVHPKTGKVCVPIDPAAAWDFDPEAVCTVGGLLNQLSAAPPPAAGAPAGEGWKATDMAAAVGTFHSCFLDALQVDSRSAVAAKARDAAAAPTLAW